MFHAIFALITTLALTTAFPSPTLLSPDPRLVVPVSLRECSLAGYGAPRSLFPAFTEYLSTLPPAEVHNTMGRVQFRQTIEDRCMQVSIFNWSCDHNLTVTGPSVANAVASIAEQCDGKVYETTGEVAGPNGFGYYKDIDTGYEYSYHLWVVTGDCSPGYLKSACSPGA